MPNTKTVGAARTTVPRRAGTGVQIQKSGESKGVLADRAMLVALTVHRWYPTAVDKEVGKEIEDQHKMQRRGEYRKRLLPHEIGKQLRAWENRIRAEHAFYTLPWADDGYRVLSGKGYQTYMDSMRKLRAEYQAFVDEFLVDYPRYRKEAETMLGGGFKESDYPSVDALRLKFGITTRVLPIPGGADFRVDVGDEEVKRIRAEIEAENKATFETAMRSVWGRLQEVVEHAATRLRKFSQGSDGKIEHNFRESLVGNITELLDVLPVLNVYDNPELTRIAAEVREKLTANPVEVLRDDAKIRENTAKAAEDILSQMSGFLA